MEKILNINVADKVATYLSRQGDIVCGNSDYRVRFTFDEEWNGKAKTARFTWNGVFEDRNLDDAGECTAPVITHADEVKVGVYSGDLATTTAAVIGCKRSIRCETAQPSVANDKYWANEAKEAADRAEAAAANAAADAAGEAVEAATAEISEIIDDDMAPFADTVVGKNLLDLSKVQKGTRFDDAGTILTGSDAATACITDFIPARSGDAVYVSYTQTDGSLKYLNARRIIGYNENKEFIGLLASSTSYADLRAEGLAYIRLQLPTASAESGGQIEMGNARTTFEEYQEHKLLKENRVLAANDLDFHFPTKYFSDCVVVGDRIWGFKESSAIGTMDGCIWVMALDEVSRTGTFMQASTVTKHDFGHVNTVAYNKYTDCLIFGNGSGDYGVAGKFYVIPEAHKLAERATNSLASLAIEYNCTAYNYGDKLNACWGHDNMGRHDIAILITNDNKNIRFVQLGKGTNNLGLGSYTSGKGANEFNGSFKVCTEYTLDDGTTHPNNTNCNQGSDYYGGKLYVSVGHEPHRHWEISFQPGGVASFVEVYEPIYDNAGNAIGGATEGMCVTDHYLITTESGTFTSGGAYETRLSVRRRK